MLRIVTRLNRGGPLRQLEALVPALAELGWAGPVLVGRCEPREPDGVEELARRGADVVRVPHLARGLHPLRDARAFVALERAIARFRPEIVHTHLAKAGALGRLAAARAGVPAVHTFHGHHLDAAGARGALARAAERALGRVTAAAVSLTASQRRDLVELHRVLPSERVALIGPALDVGALRARALPEAAALLRGRLRAGETLVVWGGRFVAAKDPLGLLEALAATRRALRLAMLGDGPLRPAALRRARALGLAGRVVFPGPVERIEPWLRAADGVVLSSRSEGAPLLLAEALALGRRVVATRVGGVADLLGEGGPHRLVPPGDPAALARALDALAAEAVAAGAEPSGPEAAVPARFDPRGRAAETAALYERSRAGAVGSPG